MANVRASVMTRLTLRATALALAGTGAASARTGSLNDFADRLAGQPGLTTIYTARCSLGLKDGHVEWATTADGSIIEPGRRV